MSADQRKTPRVIFMRHGETDWARDGRSTGTTDVPLNEAGLQEVRDAVSKNVGNGKLIDPARLVCCYVSPRTRAKQTLEPMKQLLTCPIRVSEAIREWDYGDYEGLTDEQIRTEKEHKGLDENEAWSIWRDGCPGGESPEDITARLTGFIKELREIQEAHLKDQKSGDVLIVGHGLSLRCFVKLWLGMPIDGALEMVLLPAGIGCLSYNTKKKKPAIHIGF